MCVSVCVSEREGERGEKSQRWKMVCLSMNQREPAVQEEADRGGQSTLIYSVSSTFSFSLSLHGETKM